MTDPTPFADLNDVVRELTEEVRDALGNDLIGVYLVGSFALGAGDEHSDVDFLAPVRGPIAVGQERAVREIHASFPMRPSTWAQHLEGSYPPADDLRTLQGLGHEWLYVDNGASEMERSTHCNTAISRWVLREHGIALHGPNPHELVDPITANDLRDESVRMADDYLAWLRQEEWRPLADAWAQPYVVTTYCRILWMHEHGTVATKPQALAWALDALDPEWHELIQAAIDDRPDPWNRVGADAQHERIEPTGAFVRYAVGLTAR